jgi:biotin synthase
MIVMAGTKNYSFLQQLTDGIIGGVSITMEEAKHLISFKTHEEIIMLMAHATVLRNLFKGRHIDLCGVVNAKSGRCAEDCIFCAQSAHHKADVKTYPLLDVDELVRSADEAYRSGAHRFGLVTSGKGITRKDELDTLCHALEKIAQETDLTPCASLGVLNDEQLKVLSAAGLKRYHHNLETAESYFPHICSTHSYQERVQTVRAAQEAGLEICSGALFGLGETEEQRIELAFALRELNVDSIPLNFLNPVPGTPLENNPMLDPLEILKIISLFRFILPEKDIRVCGGREMGLRTLQTLMYVAGANGTMVGNYLTTSGRNPAVDIQEIYDLGLVPHVRNDT